MGVLRLVLGFLNILKDLNNTELHTNEKWDPLTTQDTVGGILYLDLISPDYLTQERMMVFSWEYENNPPTKPDYVGG